jgi:excisionase family DNA binding protein
VEPPQDLVRIGAVARELGVSPSRVRQLADEGSIPSTRTSGGHRLFDLARVREALARRALPASGRRPRPDLLQEHVPAGLEEHILWREAAERLHLSDRVSANCWGAAQYAFSEMVNNAIDHARATRVIARWWVDRATLSFEVDDDGSGVFARIREGLDLGDSFSAIQELSKGKTTTDPARHTGEGIFFTSKVVDAFVLDANGLRWTVDNLRGDQAVGLTDRIYGTLVRCELDAQLSRSTSEVFAAYSIDHDFARTRAVVQLFSIGVRFISRSEARRLLAGLERFRDVMIDFRGVQEVGQGFVDEVFRVWPSQHPDVTVRPVNMVGPVEAMVRRGLPAPPTPSPG